VKYYCENLIIWCSYIIWYISYIFIIPWRWLFNSNRMKIRCVKLHFSRFHLWKSFDGQSKVYRPYSFHFQSTKLLIKMSLSSARAAERKYVFINVWLEFRRTSFTRRYLNRQQYARTSVHYILGKFNDWFRVVNKLRNVIHLHARW